MAVSATYFGAWALHWLPGRGQRVDLEHMEVSGGHLFERFRLFFLIALGEAVFLTGNALTDTELGFERFLAVSIAFTGIVVLWWIYFQGERFTLGAREDSGTVGWQGTIALTLAILGVIAVAVGDELAIARPTGDAMAGFAPLAFGGPALVLVAQTYFLGDRSDRLSRSRLLGIGALAALGAVASLLPAIIGLAAATGALVAVAIADVGAPREPR